MPLHPAPPSSNSTLTKRSSGRRVSIVTGNNNDTTSSSDPHSFSHRSGHNQSSSSSSRRVAKLENYSLPDELPEDDEDEMLRQLGVKSEADLFTPPQAQIQLSDNERKRPSLPKIGITRRTRQNSISSSKPAVLALELDDDEDEKENRQRNQNRTAQNNKNNDDDNSDPLLCSLSGGPAHQERDPLSFMRDQQTNITPPIAAVPLTCVSSSSQNNNNGTPSMTVMANQVSSTTTAMEPYSQQQQQRRESQSTNSNIVSFGGLVSFSTADGLDDNNNNNNNQPPIWDNQQLINQRRLTRSNSRTGKKLIDIVEPTEQEASMVFDQSSNFPAANRTMKYEEAEALEGEGGAGENKKSSNGSSSAPLWPELPSHLQNSINIATGIDQKFQDLFGGMEPSPHSAHQIGKSPQEELVEEEEDELDMLETLVAGPKVSAKTAATIGGGSSKPMYYFQQKQILDQQAGTLEGGAPAIVSAAVRANQSPFSPWCSFHQDLVNRANPEYAVEIERMLEEGVSTSAVDAGSVMATPLGFNAAWRTTGLMIDPRNGNLVLNPAVIVPGAVMTRPDAATNLGVFKAIVIRGIPKFERGIQTTLTSYHETTVWYTICRNALQQMEQIARFSISSERSFAVLHMCGMEQHERNVAQWNTDIMKKYPTNVYSLYLASVREMKGEKQMLQNLLTVPTSDGKTIKDVLEPDQEQVFQNGINLADKLINVTVESSLPILELIKMETIVREQEVRSYQAWVGSMQYRAALIRMSYARRCSAKVKHGLRTSTVMDDQIRLVKDRLLSVK